MSRSCFLACFASWTLYLTLSPALAQLANQTAPPNVAIGVTASSVELSTELERRQQHFQLMQLLDQLEPYSPLEKLEGKVQLNGSRTMSDIGHQWAENFKQFHPSVEFEGKADGSEIALKQLAENPTSIAGVSRPVDEADQKLLQSGKCKEPIAVTVGIEAMALYVHKSNPLAGVSPETVKAIFAAGVDGKPKAKLWGDLGVEGGLASAPIVAYERDAASGSQTFLSRVLLSGAQVAPSHKICESNFDVCKSIGADPKGVGFADINYFHPEVRRVPVLVQGNLIEANEAMVLAGKYPIVRPLLVVFDKSQLAGDGKLRESILRYLLSRDGQSVVVKAGFYPADPGFIKHQLTEIFGQQLR